MKTRWSRSFGRRAESSGGRLARSLGLSLAVAVIISLAVGLPALDAAAEGEATAKKKESPQIRPQADMEKQETRLEKLQPEKRDPTAPPPNVDPALWQRMIPEDNPLTEEKIALGRKLYFDERLSADGTVSCATCHDTTRGFTDMRPISEGIDQKLGTRNAPTTMNAVLLRTQFWDGRAATLEEQAGLPILNPVEMGRKSKDEVVAAVKAMPDYPDEFRKVFGRDVNYADIERAIAAFERTLVFFDSPFDRFVAGDESAMSEDAIKGWDIFNNKGRCMTCHAISPSTPLFTDNRFHNIGVAARHQDFEKKAREALELLDEDASAQALDRLALETNLGELGRFIVTRRYADVGAFRTQQLRNVGVTAPYMHDGSMDTLWDVMDHYNKGGEPNPYLDGGMVPLALTDEEIDQVVAFMFALTSDRLADMNREEFARQKKLAATKRPFRDQEMAFKEKIGFAERVGAFGSDQKGAGEEKKGGDE